MGSRRYCRPCGRSFGNHNDYTQHKRSHMARNIECTHCYSKFAQVGPLFLHLERFCKNGINRSGLVSKAHAMDPTGIITLNTHYESDDGSSVSGWDEYDYDQNWNGYWVCKKCDSTREYVTENAVIQHLNSPRHERCEFHCGGCRAHYTNLSGLAQHLESTDCYPKGLRALKRIVYSLRSGRRFRL